MSSDIEFRLFQETATDCFYDRYQNGEWLGSVRQPKDLYNDRLTKDDGFFLWYDRHDKTGKYLSSFFKLKEPLWFVGRPHAALAKYHNITVDRDVADRLLGLFNYAGGGIDFYYYIGTLIDHGCFDEAVKWLMGPVAALITKKRRILSICCATALSTFCLYLAEEKFPKHFAKEVFDKILERNPIFPQAFLDDLLKDPKYAPVDAGAVEAAIAAVFAANPEKVAEARANPKMIQWFVGQTLKANKGMSPALVKEALEKQLA